MRIRTSWRRTSALLITGALVLTACGGGDDADPEDETATSEDATEEDMADEEDATEDDMADEDMSDMEVTFAEGVTEEPCPDGDPDRGCIYLGAISDLTEGPFAALGGPITDAQVAFWERVNEEGGIGGQFDVNIEENIRDNKYNPETHNAVYQEIKPNILALGQSLGSPTTAAISDDLTASNIIAAPASWTSQNEFVDVIVESGNNYCVEAANGLDYYASTVDSVGSVMAVHYPGDYGWDGAAGAQKWAAANSVDFTAVEQVPVSVGGTTDGAIAQIIQLQPDVVVLTVAPTETAQIVGGAAAQGYTGRFIGNSPTWNPALLDTPALPALQGLYWQAGPWAPYETDTPGHTAMREALGDIEGNGGHVSGWAWSYPIKAALDAAWESGDLTRAGVVAALTDLGTVDYEGMVPEAAGNFAGTAQEQSFNETVIAEVNPETSDGVSLLEDFFEGPTVGAFPFEAACFVEEGFAG